MIKNKIKKKLFLYLASISLVSIKEKMIEEEEELVEWMPVEKLETSKILVCQTYSDEDLFKNINNDMEDMKKKDSEVYALQDKKQYKKKNKVKDIQLNIPEKEKIVEMKVLEENK